MKKTFSARSFSVKLASAILIVGSLVASCEKQGMSPAINNQDVSSVIKKVPPPLRDTVEKSN